MWFWLCILDFVNIRLHRQCDLIFDFSSVRECLRFILFVKWLIHYQESTWFSVKWMVRLKYRWHAKYELHDIVLLLVVCQEQTRVHTQYFRCVQHTNIKRSLLPDMIFIVVVKNEKQQYRSHLHRLRQSFSYWYESEYIHRRLFFLDQ